MVGRQVDAKVSSQFSVLSSRFVILSRRSRGAVARAGAAEDDEGSPDARNVIAEVRSTPAASVLTSGLREPRTENRELYNAARP
jgi:hypothetical protein